MRKYGEILRFKHNNILYILGAEKVWPSIRGCEEITIPFLYFSRAKKTVKDNRDKHQRRYELDSQVFNYSLISRIVDGFNNYFNYHRPTWLCFRPEGWGNEYNKRLKSYTKTLNRLGYDFVKEVDTEEELVTYFKRREN